MDARDIDQADDNPVFIRVPVVLFSSPSTTHRFRKERT
ncbi:hypothetical protein AS9A_3887 [Hoyosella subflava DQS3-9A1]|uniref:Uncharacterized protein n=1 Tax=Hoyosella subflava (strain DSM 45089 / JCM 17490 / NBRC 109087 / DQS3-9A1) TaxID=443218 RepID=F6EGT7_HOYSD|nr:hypothetical protein AS9A_3887 [Hoyosella subflava DQS3-9A1]